MRWHGRCSYSSSAGPNMHTKKQSESLPNWSMRERGAFDRQALPSQSLADQATTVAFANPARAIDALRKSRGTSSKDSGSWNSRGGGVEPREQTPAKTLLDRDTTIPVINAEYVIANIRSRPRYDREAPSLQPGSFVSCTTLIHPSSATTGMGLRSSLEPVRVSPLMASGMVLMVAALGLIATALITG